ncbi:MAG: hypothetical protein GEU93_03355 [Propionibacteriales bacterium]|nr:hypothetical protein [Propionibacteriales bacterium]
MRLRTDSPAADPPRRTSIRLIALVALITSAVVASTLSADAVPARSGVPGTVTTADPGSADGSTPDVRVHALDVPSADVESAREFRSSGPRLAAELPPRDTAGFGLVALTWRSGTAPEGLELQVRVREDAEWTGWGELEYEPEEGPSGAEALAATRDGTAPAWVGDADGVQARVFSSSGEAPQDLQVSMIDADASPTDESPDQLATSDTTTDDVTTSGSRFTPRPDMISRRGWGADPSLTSQCDSPRAANTVRLVFVHHTVNSNEYTRSEAVRIVRSVYAYHTQSRGWCDIGYNFLVDRFGRIYEGRRGGVNVPIRGAHVSDFNTGSSGMALIGNFENTRPSKRMRGGLRRLVSWKLASFYRYPRATITMHGQRLRVISGHRDAGTTACPGRYVYQWLPTLRQQVYNRIGKPDTPNYRKWPRFGPERLGQPFYGEVNSIDSGRKTIFNKGHVYWKSDLDAHVVRNGILKRWKHHNGVRGRFGYPVSDSYPVDGRPGWLQKFQGGRGYNHREVGPRLLWKGAILKRYRNSGGVKGRLGFPVREIYPVRVGTRAEFRGGWITWHRSTGNTTVKFK